MYLTSTDVIKVVTSATAAIDVHASWTDYASGTVTPGRTNTAISSAATTTVVGSPASTRAVRCLTLRNKDGSVANTITVQHSDGSTTVDLINCTLAAGEELHWNDDGFWRVRKT